MISLKSHLSINPPEQTAPMRRTLILSGCLVAFLTAGSAAWSEVKKVPFTKVDVDVEEAYQPDAAFQAMQKSFSDAVKNKNSQALFDLVGPTFVWTTQGALVEDYNLGRDALHNFKVVFGFREAGKDTDGGVQDGPFWAALAGFTNDGTYYKAADNLVCGPIRGTAHDDDKFTELQNKIESDDSVSWYFTLSDKTIVTKSPTDTAQVATISKQVIPVLSMHPPETGTQPAPPVTHLEVLIPTGKTGWIPVSAARPLETDRLCYAATQSGQWKIVMFEQADEATEEPDEQDDQTEQEEQ